VRHNIDVHLETLGQDLVKAVQDEATGHVNVERLLAELGRPSGDSHESRLDILAKLVGAMRLLDEAVSLKGILDALSRGAAGQADRVGVFLVDGQTIRSFSDFGFGGQKPGDVPLDTYGAISRAVTERQRTSVSASGGALPGDVPSFMRPAAGKAGLLIPLAVGGNVVALVFAEGPDRHAHPETGGVWTESIEVLVRHAASRLENVTSSRTVEVLTKPA
jgi:hypothetical protein